MEEIAKWFKNLFSGNFKITSNYNYTHEYAKTHDEEGNYTGGLFSSTLGNLQGLIDSLVGHFTRANLTGAEREQNEWNAAEAQKSRDFTEYMARNKYSMETQSMQEAGVNPAMVYGGGNLVPTAANGATGTGTASAGGDIFAALSTIVRLPGELKKLAAEAEARKQEGDAARENADANRVNAEANALKAQNDERRIALEERGLDLEERKVQVQEALKDNDIRMTDQQIEKLVVDCAYVSAMTSQLPAMLEVAQKNADSSAKQAIAAMQSAAAAMKQAEAAQQNADTNAMVGSANTEYMAACAALQTAMKNTYEENLKWLPQEKAQQIENMKKQGINLDKQGNLIDKQGRLVDAKMRHEYVQLGCDVVAAGCQVVGTVATGGVGGAMVKGPSGARTPAFDGTGYDGVYGTFGD